MNQKDGEKIHVLLELGGKQMNPQIHWYSRRELWIVNKFSMLPEKNLVHFPMVVWWEIKLYNCKLSSPDSSEREKAPML